MSQEPKKRHSSARQGKRRASIKLEVPHMSLCANCGNKHISHMVCPSCGFYKGQQIITIKGSKETQAKQPTSA